ncbi:hypothetical protein PIB30_020030 [Stylosanthes scabra]|uniref:Uncharacterized protein n=1 Tax=Stylosanthes scabra TaxID=79078 RepID=A0ABU6R8P0_9FABA|nr:hypothetical protein [Stylosanthes scabra]
MMGHKSNLFRGGLESSAAKSDYLGLRRHKIGVVKSTSGAKFFPFPPQIKTLMSSSLPSSTQQNPSASQFRLTKTLLLLKGSFSSALKNTKDTPHRREPCNCLSVHVHFVGLAHLCSLLSLLFFPGSL